MPKIPSTLSNLPSDKAWTSLRQVYEQLARIFNGGIGLAPPNGNNQANPSVVPCDNIDAVCCLYTTGTAGTDDAVTHNLGRIPVGYIVIGTSAAVTIYNSPTSSSTTVIYLRSTLAATVVKILVF